MSSLHALNLRQMVDGRAVLDDITMSVAPGEIVGLVGPNGAGKSTLVRAMLGQSRPTRGEVRLDVRNILSMSVRERARHIAYVPQRAPEGFPVSVFDTCLLGRAPYMRTRPSGHDISIVEQVLDQLQLTHLAFRTMDALSGGERQRVMLARALAQQTPLIVLDEPTSALDIGNQLFTLRLLAEQVRERGIGVMIAIHDLSLAARFATRIILLDRGKMLAEGAWHDTLTAETIQRSYGVEVEFGQLRNAPIIAPFEMGEP
ncbi:ABC transporter ATP-binding protein [Primorskyibacter marinus]|uniref:ABC transporter ATP-binding protein n=1 Tax=Primorskyibacter marinus TaxID=1977320 RepID=UPI000E3055C1|nr:ABC transporter ATP-binding protein [Primorskyibacter marinus]